MSTLSERSRLVSSFRDHYAIAILLQDVGHAHHHDVVIVNQRDRDRGAHTRNITSLGV